MNDDADRGTPILLVSFIRTRTECSSFDQASFIIDPTKTLAGCFQGHLLQRGSEDNKQGTQAADVASYAALIGTKIITRRIRLTARSDQDQGVGAAVPPAAVKSLPGMIWYHQQP